MKLTSTENYYYKQEKSIKINKTSKTQLLKRSFPK